jgi:D-sedoheptulose 7-phosphate isomerase
MKLKTYSHIDLLIERCPALSICRSAIEESAAAIVDCHRSGGKVLLCGNGGSAADAEHIVGELSKSFILPRPLPAAHRDQLTALYGAEGTHLSDRLQQGVKAIALSGCSPLATAISNDGDPTLVFAQMTYVYGVPGDVLIGISTSGNSTNIVAAMKVAKAIGMHTIGLTGASDAAMDPLSDYSVKVPAHETYKIQEYHLPIYHAICLTVEAELFGALPAD